MYKWTVLYIFFFGFFLQALATITINEINGTESAQLGTNTTTIKCDYEYQNETGVEIKWFFNDSMQIFIWVPGHNEPQAMGPFSNILDVNNNSIRFKEMTKNLTGYYTCKVSSFEAEAIRTEMMIAYQPPVKVEFFPEIISETLICSAYELYPRPIITITGSQVSETNTTVPLTNESEEPFFTEDDLYNVTKTLKFDNKDIEKYAEFICNVYIPETEYNETITITYEKLGNDSSTTTEYPDEFTTILPTETSFRDSSNISTTNHTTIQGAFSVQAGHVTKYLVLLMLVVNYY